MRLSKMKQQNMDEIKRELSEKLAVPLWPTAGKALDLRRGATYRAAAEGSIPTLDVGRLKRVSTSWLRQKLGLGRAGDGVVNEIPLPTNETPGRD
jgi:hypothetical protein